MLFSEIFRRFFEGRERIGMSLTGGLDTRIVMAWQPASRHRYPVTPSGECSATVRTSSLRAR